MKQYIEHIREIVESEPNDMIMGGMIRKYFNKVDTPEPMKCKLCDTEVTENTKSHVYSDPVCYDCANKHHQSEQKYTSFMNQYRKDHALCPKCKNSCHYSTLVSFAYNTDKPEEYKDLNKCVCSKCGDKHIGHERISI
jgi:hypothetical protein